MKLIHVLISIAFLSPVFGHADLLLPSDIAGSVSKLDGQLKDGSGNELKIGSAVRWGETLETGEKSRATIKLNDQAAFIMNPNSKLTVKKEWNDDVTVLGLVRGGLLSFINKKFSKKETYRVRTTTTTIGVRGTTFFIQDDGSSGSYLCSCYGSVNVRTPKHVHGKILVGKAHDTQRVISPSGELKRVNDPKGHTEDDVKFLQSLFK